MANRLNLLALPGMPMVAPGDDLSALIVEALALAGERLCEGDLLVLAQKIVSKAEGRYVSLASVEPGFRARRLARKTEKDPRLVQLILNESRKVLRHRPGLIVVEHRLGFVHANAGIDHSNLPPHPEDPRVLLLPEDSDGSAARLRDNLRRATGIAPAVIVNDSAGRAWRMGIQGIALGAAGIQSLQDRRGATDLFGRTLEVTEIAVADELAAAASLLMGQGAESSPVVLVRGLAELPASPLSPPARDARALLRPEREDLFR